MISSYWQIVYERDKFGVFDILKSISLLFNLVLIDDIFTGKRRQKVISDIVTEKTGRQSNSVFQIM